MSHDEQNSPNVTGKQSLFARHLHLDQRRAKCNPSTAAMEPWDLISETRNKKL